RLRERLPDRVEQAGVGGRVAAPGSLDPALVDHDHALATGDRTSDQRALARARHPGDGHQHPQRDVDVDVSQVVLARAAYLDMPDGGACLVLQSRLVVEVLAGHRVAGAQLVETTG